MSDSLLINLTGCETFSEVMRTVKSRGAIVFDPKELKNKQSILIGKVKKKYPIIYSSDRHLMSKPELNRFVIIMTGLSEEGIERDSYIVTFLGIVARKVKDLALKNNNFLALLNPRCFPPKYGLICLEVGPSRSVLFYSYRNLEYAEPFCGNRNICGEGSNFTPQNNNSSSRELIHYKLHSDFPKTNEGLLTEESSKEGGKKVVDSVCSRGSCVSPISEFDNAHSNPLSSSRSESKRLKCCSSVSSQCCYHHCSPVSFKCCCSHFAYLRSCDSGVHFSCKCYDHNPRCSNFTKRKNCVMTCNNQCTHESEMKRTRCKKTGRQNWPDSDSFSDISQKSMHSSFEERTGRDKSRSRDFEKSDINQINKSNGIGYVEHWLNLNQNLKSSCDSNNLDKASHSYINNAQRIVKKTNLGDLKKNLVTLNRLKRKVDPSNGASRSQIIIDGSAPLLQQCQPTSSVEENETLSKKANNYSLWDDSVLGVHLYKTLNEVEPVANGTEEITYYSEMPLDVKSTPSLHTNIVKELPNGKRNITDAPEQGILKTSNSVLTDVDESSKQNISRVSNLTRKLGQKKFQRKQKLYDKNLETISQSLGGSQPRIELPHSKNNQTIATDLSNEILSCSRAPNIEGQIQNETVESTCIHVSDQKVDKVEENFKIESYSVMQKKTSPTLKLDISEVPGSKTTPGFTRNIFPNQTTILSRKLPLNISLKKSEEKTHSSCETKTGTLEEICIKNKFPSKPKEVEPYSVDSANQDHIFLPRENNEVTHNTSSGPPIVSGQYSRQTENPSGIVEIKRNEDVNQLKTRTETLEDTVTSSAECFLSSGGSRDSTNVCKLDTTIPMTPPPRISSEILLSKELSTGDLMKFHLKSSITKVEPDIGSSPFDLVSGRCTQCHQVHSWSKLIPTEAHLDNGLRIFNCPTCHSSGKNCSVELFFLYKIYIGNESARIVILAIGSPAQTFLGVSIKKFLSNIELALKYQKAIAKILVGNPSRTCYAPLFYITFTLKMYQHRIIPILYHIEEPLPAYFFDLWS